mmetsp:Transcript_13612/g.20506  ORF Transcript_13612/g.20506 Transcript_13612/m.20506 type:complete len:305 (+) Transcript_13612:111-1025(+)|eukprot:CAMPEP_0201552540 /NCGR_PEP_ID=MMETSP0173_2-20130828/16776_1 /ASSEMBLY_ACC=CAM_ASM_000268 /TAXON_ID=218659 /ORGANISM="Vexillifera sp., Strain DIVA3 564/2" /LENGTH=304 /DNA_ID=CAMNT_0047963041 /DNA_START=53 /DNA_END=967 /DNA_ORIENTATION=+
MATKFCEKVVWGIGHLGTALGTFALACFAYSANKTWKYECAQKLVEKVQDEYRTDEIGNAQSTLARFVEQRYAEQRVLQETKKIEEHRLSRQQEEMQRSVWLKVMIEIAAESMGCSGFPTDQLLAEVATGNDFRQMQGNGTQRNEEVANLEEIPNLEISRRRMTQYWESVRFSVQGIPEGEIRDKALKRLVGKNCDRLHLFFLACQPLNWGLNTKMTERVIRIDEAERDRELVTELHHFFRKECLRIYGDDCVFSTSVLGTDAEEAKEIEKKVCKRLIEHKRKELFNPPQDPPQQSICWHSRIY